MYKIIGADQKEYGPVTADQLRQWIAEGRVNAQTLLQAEGQTDWRPLSSYPEFAAATAPPPGLAPTVPPSVNAASLISGPATGLMVVGILSAFMAVWRIAMSVFGWGAEIFRNAGRGGPGMPPQFQHLVDMMSGRFGTGVGVFGLVVSA